MLPTPDFLPKAAVPFRDLARGAGLRQLEALLKPDRDGAVLRSALEAAATRGHHLGDISATEMDLGLTGRARRLWRSADSEVGNVPALVQEAGVLSDVRRLVAGEGEARNGHGTAPASHAVGIVQRNFSLQHLRTNRRIRANPLQPLVSSHRLGDRVRLATTRALRAGDFPSSRVDELEPKVHSRDQPG